MYTSETPIVSGSSELTNYQRDPTKKGNSSNIIGEFYKYYLEEFSISIIVFLTVTTETILLLVYCFLLEIVSAK